MPRLTIEDLKRIKDGRKAEFIMREGGHRAKITVHMGTCGIASGARAVMEALLHEIAKTEEADVIVTASGCVGHCAHEPLATVEIRDQKPKRYCNLTGEKIREILRKHVLGGIPLEHYALATEGETT